MIAMADETTEPKNALLQKLEEIEKRVKSIKARVQIGEANVGDDIVAEVRDLDQLVRDLKAQIGMSAFDKTAYQREYMRKKRATHPEYGALARTVHEDVPPWLKSKFDRP